MSPAHSLVAINFKAEIVALLAGGTGRARVGAGRMPGQTQIPGAGYAPDHRLAKSPLARVRGGRPVAVGTHPALTTHTLDSTVEYRVWNGGMRSSQAAAARDGPDAAPLRAEDLLAGPVVQGYRVSRADAVSVVSSVRRVVPWIFSLDEIEEPLQPAERTRRLPDRPRELALAVGTWSMRPTADATITAQSRRHLRASRADRYCPHRAPDSSPSPRADSPRRSPIAQSMTRLSPPRPGSPTLPVDGEDPFAEAVLTASVLPPLPDAHRRHPSRPLYSRDRGEFSTSALIACAVPLYPATPNPNGPSIRTILRALAIHRRPSANSKLGAVTTEFDTSGRCGSWTSCIGRHPPDARALPHPFSAAPNPHRIQIAYVPGFGPIAVWV